METGHSPRPDKVFHRSASSISDLKTFSYDWKKILTGADLFHTSGVTTGLSVELTAEVKKAMSMAREMKIPVSYDFNYRKNIWSIEEFVQRQKDLLPLIDILFCSDSDLDLFFGKRSEEKDYSAIFASTSLKSLVLNRRSHDESEYGIDVVTSSGAWSSKRHKVQSLDRIGVGDSMAAGFIKAYLSKVPQTALADWAALAGALKYGIKGDMALLKTSELETLLAGNTRGIDR
jgi:2-dehydro-3-deoxygluconokinase